MNIVWKRKLNIVWEYKNAWMGRIKVGGYSRSLSRELEGKEYKPYVLLPGIDSSKLLKGTVEECKSVVETLIKYWFDATLGQEETK